MRVVSHRLNGVKRTALGAAALPFAACLLGVLPPSLLSAQQTPLEQTQVLQLAAPLTVIGQSSALPGHTLHRVMGAFRHTNGSLVIADGGSNEIRVFNAAGNLIRTMGGSGQGPENFVNLQALWSAPPDTIVGFDMGSQRLAYWRLHGSFVGSVNLGTEAIQVIVARFADGSYLGMRTPRPGRTPEGTSRLDSALLIRISAEGRQLNDVGRIPWETWHARRHPLAQRVMYTPSPFDGTGLVAASGSEIFHAYGTEARIRRFSLSGQSRSDIELRVAAARLAPEVWNRWIDSRVSRLDDREGPALRRVLESLPRPSTLPLADMLLVDDEGLLWLREFVAPGATRASWHVVDPNGRERARLEVSATFRPLHIGAAYLVAVTREEDDTEVVQLLAKPALRGR